MRSLPPEEEHHADMIKKQALLEVLRWTFYIMVAMLALSGIAIAAWTGVQTNKINHFIEDCTNPEGECAQQGAQDTATLVKTLIDSDTSRAESIKAVSIMAAYCANILDNDTAVKVEECVNNLLEK